MNDATVMALQTLRRLQSSSQAVHFKNKSPEDLSEVLLLKD
jgi:hypothetical protein